MAASAAVVADPSGAAAEEPFQLIEGDAIHALDRVPDGSCKLVITSPPYNIGKEYEKDERLSLRAYLRSIDRILEKLCKKVQEDGHLCWQTGNFVENGELFPLDSFFYRAIKRRGLKLRNRIIWHFNFGLNAQRRFSGRYETLLWFTKSDNYTFNLDPVRERQLYPGKRHSSKKGDLAGKPSGNPKGKNPSDFWVFKPEEDFRDRPVWDFPNVKANHCEKTEHPCQFPTELVRRCVLALTNEGDMVLDPFLGSGTTAIGALKHNRRVIGIDKDPRYVKIALERIERLKRDELPLRPLAKPVRKPREGESVSTVPREWLEESELGETPESGKGERQA